MRLRLFVLFAALLLATVAAQNTLMQSTGAQTTTSAITACAVQGGSCSQPSLDSPPGTVLSHLVYAGGCSQRELHVLRYVPTDTADGSLLLAAWCA